jgi:PAS domain S-box-containing protein
MRLITLFLFSLLILAGWTRAYAQADDPPKPDPVILTDEQDEHPLGLHLEILEDPGGELTIEDVSAPDFDSHFTPSQEEVPNYGFTNSAYWLRLHLRNEAYLNDRWLLELANANMHFVDLYSPLPDGDGYKVMQTGALRPPANRYILHPHIVFNLAIPTQSEQTFYLRFQNGASMTLPLTLWEPETFFASSLQKQIWQGLFLGVMVGLLGYNLFLLFSVRDVSYLYMVLLLGGIIIYDVSQTGFLEFNIAPSLYYLKLYSISLAVALIIVSLILFNDSFLSARTLFPRVHLMNVVFAVVWGVLGLMIFVISYHDLAVIITPAIIVTLVVVATTAVFAWRKGFRAARFLLIAWAGLLAGILLFILTRMGFLSSNIFTENTYRVAFAWMAMCWSIALADRINLLKAETEDANRELGNSERRLSQILQGLPLGVVVYGKDFKPKYVNQRVFKILGNPERGIVPDISAGRTLDQAMDYYSFRVEDSDQEYPLEKLPVYRALQGQPASADDIEADLVDKRVPLEIWASPVRDDAGDVESAVVTFQDITARKQAEMALRASEKKFRVIVENAFDGIVFMAHDRQALYVSSSYSRLSGFSVKETVGQSGTGFVHPDDQARIAQVFAELLQQPGSGTTVEYRSRHQDGSWIWVETNALNLLDDPHVGAVVLNIHDITERKRAEAELKQYQEHLQLLVEKRSAELSATNAWLSMLARVRQTISGTTDLPQAYDKLFASIPQLLNARLVFLHRWDGQDGQIKTVYNRQQDDSIQGIEEIAAIIQDDSPLRKEIDKGKPIHLSADQADSLPATRGKFFQEDDFQSLLLSPMVAGQSVAGFLGVAKDQPMQEFTPAQVELVKIITLDLANLAEGAQLLDQAQAVVVAEERNRLARELHDSLTQILFSASVLAEATPRIWDKDQEIARMNMEKLSLLIRGALAETRSLLLELRSGELRGQTPEKLLTTLVEAVQARTQFAISLTINDDPKLPDNVTQAFYRIAREALNNVIIHAEATQVNISLLNERHSVELRIQDDGRGFDPQDVPPGHMGISIMSERAAQIGGELRIESEPGHGTQIIVTWFKTGGESGEND